MKITSYKKWIAVAAIVLFGAFSASAQTASFSTTTTNFDPAGGSATFDVGFDFTGETLSSTLGFIIDLPEGWSYASVAGADVPEIKPTSGTTERAEFGWAFTFPSNKFNTAVTLNYAAGLDGDQLITGHVIYKFTGGQTQNANFDSIVIAAPPVAPAITAEPMSLTVNEGLPASFTVAASGNPAPTFQWKKDGGDISGATDSVFSISVVSAADAGSYTVVATNSEGSATSQAAILSVNEGPMITAQPMSMAVNLGADVSFSVSASGAVPLSYQWRKDGSPISGATDVTLQLNGVETPNAGSYDVVITNSVSSVTSDAAILTVIEPPMITSQPISKTVNEGDFANFVVGATGTDPLDFQWSKDGSPIEGAAATDSSFEIASATRGDAGAYSVSVSNAAGNVMSEMAVLTVQFTPVILTQPTDQTGGVGGSVVFSVEAEGLPTPMFQWRQGGADLPGETGSTLSLSGLELPQNGAIYDVVVTNSVGSVTSSEVTLTVNQGPAIVTQPQSVSVGVGGTASFFVDATGNPTPTYQWKKDGVDITGETSSTLNFSSVTKADDGEYSVVVTNEVDSATSVTVDLDVLFKPEITEQPTDQTGSVGGSVTFNVEGDGNPEPSFQWFRNDSPITSPDIGELTLTNLQLSDDGATFYMEATNSQGTTRTDTVTLTVNEGAAITGQPQSQSVGVGSSATFMVVATGNPAPTYQWQKDGADISGATDSTLTISSVAKANKGKYTVVVTNSGGTATSEEADLDVLFKPEITVQPTDMTGSVGGSVTIEVEGDSNPEPTFQWFRDGSPITGATEGELMLDNLQLSDDGAKFYLVATNSEGSVTSDEITLTVNEGAAITAQPQGATVMEGDSVSLYVMATGNPAPTYQWKKDGVDIAGATSEIYDIAVTSRSDAGEYTVVVDNGVGSATSEIAVLDVQYAPEIATQPSDTAVGVGGSATFTVAVSANPAATIQWFRGTEALSGETNSTLTVSGLTLKDSGSTFHAVATSSIDTVTSSTATLTVREIPAITSQPTGGSVNAGGSFTFTVTATGTPTPTYQWRKGGVAISGATGNSLTLSSLKGTDAGDYSVVVSNAQGSVTSSVATLVVPTPPVITANPVGGKKVVGESFTFSVIATGTAPFTYQWKKDGTNISGATAANLALTSLKVEDAGSYSVTVSNSVGPVDSTAAVLEVDKALKAPTFTKQPANTSVRTGGSATLTVAAAGNPVPTYQWFKNNVAISGQTGTSLAIANAAVADQASYHVVATNTQGTAKSDLVRVTVTTADVAPVITSQPRNRTVVKDGSVTFTVVATGVPEPTFQWRLNSVPITGATSASYTIASAAAADAGTYSVVVSNSVGDVTSRNAILAFIETSYQGTYFGSFGTDRGSFAVTINADNTGTFLGFDEIAGLYVQGKVIVADDGSFSLEVESTSTTGTSSTREGSADQPVGTVDGAVPGVARDLIVFSAKIGPDGAVGGTVTGVAGLSMTAQKEEGTTESAGYYQAASGGTDDVTFTIVAPSGKVLLVTKNAAGGGDAGVGSASAEGAITVTTVKNNTVKATVSAATSEIAAEVTDSAGAKTTFSGGNAEVIATQRLVNISSRAVAGSGSEKTIAGLVITGEDSKSVLIRAIGPGLGDFGVSGVLSAPKLELFEGQTVIATNTGWSSADNAAEVVAAAASVGAFALDTGNADSVLLETLAPGAYTAAASGSDGGSGVVLIEVYDLSAPAAGQKLFNISTRAVVGSGDGTVVAGFVVSGTVPKRVLLRGAGPALGSFGLEGALSDPQLKLFKGQTQVAFNDNWGTNAAAVTSASTTTGAFQFAADSKDAAMVLSLEPGAYTLQISGVGGAAGIGLIEVYEIP